MSQKIKVLGQDKISETSLDAFNILKCSPGAFDGATANARGDKDGTKAVLPLFKVTGSVLVRIFGVCTVSLTGNSGTIEVGVAGNTAALIAQETVTDIDAGMIYLSATQVQGVVALATLPGPFLVVAGHDNVITIDEKVATTDVASGNMDYICLWRPLSPDGSVESLFPPAVS